VPTCKKGRFEHGNGEWPLNVSESGGKIHPLIKKNWGARFGAPRPYAAPGKRLRRPIVGTEQKRETHARISLKNN